MPTISRERIELIYEDEVIKNSVDIKATIIPDGEVWQIKRVTFADAAAPSNLQSGKFKVDFGAGQTVAVAYLIANTIVIPVNRTFTGDGIKELRVLRENNDNQDKFMFAMVEGFKRIGDI